MDWNQIVSEVRKSTEEVFQTMLGMELEPGEAVTEHEPPGPADGVVALIGLTGSWAGTASLSCSGATAARLSSRMLMTELPAVNEEVLDAMAEITNMAIGGFKTAIEDETGPMGLSIPTIIFGRNFTARAPGKNTWVRIPFATEEGSFDIHLCLAPENNKDRRSRRAVRTGVTYFTS